MVETELIARIYEASARPDQWPHLLQDIANHMGAMGGLVMTLGGHGGGQFAPAYTPSPAIADHVDAFFAEGWHLKGRRTERLLSEQHVHFCLETDYASQAEVLAMPVHRDFLLPRGMSIGAGTAFQGLRDDAVMVSIEGFPTLATARAARAMLDRLRPHLGRALSLMARLDQARTQAAVDALALGGVAAAVIDRQGRLRAANAAFEAAMGADLSTSTRDSAAHFHDPVLHAAVQDVRAQGVPSPGRSVPLPHASGPMAAHLIPLHGGARDVAGSDGVLILLALAANTACPGADLLRLMFDLTPAEARLTRALIDGLDLTEAARRNGTAVGTARKQLSAVFAKIGVTRQVDLVRLLGGLGMPRMHEA